MARALGFSQGQQDAWSKQISRWNGLADSPDVEDIPAAVIDLALQIPLIFGFFVHWSVTAVGIIFGIVWFYIVKLRSEMERRMRGGYLVTQHLGTSEG